MIKKIGAFNYEYVLHTNMRPVGTHVTSLSKW